MLRSAERVSKHGHGGYCTIVSGCYCTTSSLNSTVCTCAGRMMFWMIYTSSKRSRSEPSLPTTCWRS
jgi:hypothetical protein